MDLRIAENLTLPRDAVTQTFAILAKRGVGKTYTASVFVEEIIKAVLPVVVIDPVGVWWGLRASADGKGPGLPIVIAGGDHADVPITPGGGEAVARLVVEENLSLVIDLSLLRKHERIHFMTDFAETLYHLNRTARHLVLDEADAFAPQRPMQGEQRMLGAMDDIVRRGRGRVGESARHRGAAQRDDELAPVAACWHRVVLEPRLARHLRAGEGARA